MNSFSFSILILSLALHMIAPFQSLAVSNQLSCMEVVEKVKNGAVLIDVRTKEEFAHGSLAGSINVPYEQIESNLDLFTLNKKKEIILFCKSGRRSELGKQTFAKLGYLNVINAGSYAELLQCWSNK